MDPLLSQALMPILCTILASGGFWAWFSARGNKRSIETELLLGIAHNKIMELCDFYIQRGNWITHDEFENLHDYLYKSYKAAGGNGTAEKAMNEVINKLHLCAYAPKETQK